MGELARASEGVTEEELARAKEVSKGRLLLRMEESRAVASSIGIQELLKNQVTTVDEMVAQIDAVTMADVARVAGRAIRPEKLAVAIVGPVRGSARFAGHLRF
jgi:predicted Zn-dependent peptidase